jgi:hypothetical protein
MSLTFFPDCSASGWCSRPLTAGMQRVMCTSCSKKGRRTVSCLSAPWLFQNGVSFACTCSAHVSPARSHGAAAALLWLLGQCVVCSSDPEDRRHLTRRCLQPFSLGQSRRGGAACRGAAQVEVVLHLVVPTKCLAVIHSITSSDFEG